MGMASVRQQGQCPDAGVRKKAQARQVQRRARAVSSIGRAGIGEIMTSPRAVRYLRLALVEQDNEKANLLRQLADEAERGVLFTVENSRYGKIEIPIKPGDVKR
jgi:hypothetical protein